MKSFIQSCVAVILLSSSSVVAQSASINSPHNYKRPVSQRASQSQAALVVPSNERPVPLKLQNNLTSVHNYKRQGTTNFAQEATVVMSVPTIGIEPQNPLVLPNHYKSHAKPASVEMQIARKNEKPKVDTLSR
ncbi:hypothetical protein [Runella slithyformis]|uniref:Uncharacterized protein n=1 Tax=Runella slithyformis (strain ATCC 29530 / DSM 19594 / LMG 11500 / NCIMB 11436 / LSU 4) TaxID=761193 RepID=A0A7U3ZMY3_RUNSL|nr:hypothetical protein [Runella slithyformis]AEI50063.1 hypothetical protein Runsl_3705 [Runella slithyformis DSM 19594]